MLENKKNVDRALTVLTVLLSNGIVVYGILFLHWSFFMVLYSYWFGELIVSIFERIAYQRVKKRKELTSSVGRKESEGRFFFLLVYWLFIVLVVGFIAASENKFGENLIVMSFRDRPFNISILVVFIGTALLYYRDFIRYNDYRPAAVAMANSLLNKRTVLMHIAVLSSAFLWFCTHVKHFFIYVPLGKQGDLVFLLLLAAVRLAGDVFWLFKKKNGLT
ncbi:MAG TPA: DUF6498-containing protein [Cytophagaceae bacterium]|nr:DUF6498-containing protein [Cytophagaceae bacterium]